LQHDFLLPDAERMGRVLRWGPGYSHHFPPAFPVALGLLFSVLGFGALQVKLALVAVALAALAAVYGTTRSLFGADRAVLVTGLVALDPSSVFVTGVGLSENFTLLFSTLTLWAFLKSLSQAWLILPAGVFWTIVYLARSSAGAFGVLPALAGAWWWQRFRGWRALASPWCLGAGLVFVGAAAAWGLRNQRLFGTWETSAYVRDAYAYGLEHPELLARAFAGKGAFFALLFLAYAGPFWPELRASLRRLRDASTSLLWLFVAVIWCLAWWVTSAFWPYEPRPFFALGHVRYVLLGVVPLFWLALREARSGSLLPRWLGCAAALALASSVVLANPIRLSSARAAEFIDPWVLDGDTLFVGGSIGKYDVDSHFSRIERISIHTLPGTRAHFALVGDVLPDPLPPGFELLGTFEQLGPLPSVTYVIAPVAVIEQRGLPTRVTRRYE
jgi:hypothetical protein